VDPPGTAVGDAGLAEDQVLEVLRPSHHLVEGRAVRLEVRDESTVRISTRQANSSEDVNTPPPVCRVLPRMIGP
jgi:hypothetical protein